VHPSRGTHSACRCAMTRLLELRDVTVRFPIGSALAARLQRRQQVAVTALDGVSLEISRGESVGIVGESGCGKSTLARTLVGLLDPTSGSVLLDGTEVDHRRTKAARRRVQMVFQDPSSSLNPARTVEQTLAELLRVHAMVPDRNVQARCEELLDLVHLPRSALTRSPADCPEGSDSASGSRERSRSNRRSSSRTRPSRRSTPRCRRRSSTCSRISVGSLG
jgi:ABC-type glutathione transport system ATPase component